MSGANSLCKLCGEPGSPETGCRSTARGQGAGAMGTWAIQGAAGASAGPGAGHPWGPGRGGAQGARGSMDAEAARGAAGEWRGGSPAAGPRAFFAGLLRGLHPAYRVSMAGLVRALRAPALQRETVHRALRAAGKTFPGVGARAPRAAHLWPPRSETAGGPGGRGLGARGSSAHPPEAHPQGVSVTALPTVPRIPGRRGPAGLTSSLPSLNLGGLGRSRWEGSVKRLRWRPAPLWPPLGDCQFRPRPSRPAGGLGWRARPGGRPLSGEPGETL